MTELRRIRASRAIPREHDPRHGRLDKFARRVARSVLFRVRKLKSYSNLIRRNLGFPVRNFLLRNRPIHVQASGLAYLLSPEGSVPLEMWSGRYFEQHEVDFIVGCLRPSMTFFDIGANVGLFSIPAAKKLTQGTVYAFEPTPLIFQTLVKNARLNNVENLRAIHSAVGDRNGEATLQVNVTGKDGLNTIGRPTHDYSEVVATETVPILTLDSFVETNAVPRVDLMKIDTEGAELLIFRGARSLLARPDAPAILFECGCLTRGFGYHPVESLWLLHSHGFHFFMMDSANGSLTPLSGSPPRDAMVFAVKRNHWAYESLKDSSH